MKTMIAIPCMDTVRTEFFQSCVGLAIDGDVQWTNCQGSLIYDARNMLAEAAIEGNFDRVLWLDSDMIFDRTLFHALSRNLDDGLEMVCGLCFTRREPIRPVIYRNLRLDLDPEKGGFSASAESITDYPKNSVFEVEACGFGAVMMTTQLLRDVLNSYGLPFSPAQGFGEDLSFCLRARELGRKIHCNSAVRLGHVGMTVFNENYWLNLRKLSD